MLTSAVLSDTNIVTAVYDGSLSSEEMASVRQQLEVVIDEQGRARLLVEYGNIDFGRIEPRAVWEDLKTAGLLPRIEKIAAVTDVRWADQLARAAGAVAPTEVKAFATTDRVAALDWIRD